MMKNSLVLTLLVIAAALGGSAQNPSERQDSAKEFWFSAEDSPLQLRQTVSRYLDLINTSDSAVTGYTLGCVFETTSGRRLEPSFIHRSLKPGLSGIDREIEPHGGLAQLKVVWQELYSDTCHNPASRLAVVKVHLANGKQWALIPQ
jgi:hypothetical protein